MHCRIYTTALVTSLCTVALITAHGWSQSNRAFFQGLGDLPGGIISSQALDVSNDGLVVVGISNSANGSEAFRWKDGILTGLGSLAGGAAFHSSATATNADGSIVVGFSKEGPDSSITGFRWTEPTGMVNIGGRDCLDISLDGNVIVGSIYHAFTCNEIEFPAGSQAAVWVGGSGAIGLSMLQDADTSTAACVSGNGSLIGGGCSFDVCNRFNSTPVTWSGGSIGLAGAPNGGIGEISPDGIAIAGISAGAGFIRINGITTTLPGSMVAYAVSYGGLRAAGTTLTAPQTAMIWDATNGTRNLKTVLETDFGLDLTGWTLGQARGISGDGSVIVGYGTNPSGQQEAWMAHVPSLDADGDGLLDTWETQNQGIDVNDDGTIDLDLYAIGARPDHKDLFIEIDCMIGRNPADLQPVVDAFANAPVANPDGIGGVKLHLQLDDTDLPLGGGWAVDSWPVQFDNLKSLYYGTASERTDPNSVAILEAKRKVFRYCIYADTSTAALGAAKGTYCNDFIIFKGSLMKLPCFGSCAVVNDQSTFMHELGHALGLDHGGSDGIFNKPNYISVMNYLYELPFSAGDAWRLDYSRGTMLPIIENNIDESVMLETITGDNLGVLTYYGLTNCVANPCDPVPAAPIQAIGYLIGTGGHDFNGDGQITSGQCMDLNYFGTNSPVSLGSIPTPCEVMNDHNDWAALQYKPVDEGVPLAGGLPANPPIELTIAEIEMLYKSLPGPPCLADVTGDQTVNVDDLLAVINGWGECDRPPVNCAADIAPLPVDGIVNVDDLLKVINGWGECE